MPGWLRRGTPILFLLAVACSASRIESGVFYSPKGYEVRLPAGAWRVKTDDQADLELRDAASGAGILVHATCGGNPPRRSLPVLARHLSFGLEHRRLLEEAEVTVAGHPAVRVLLEGQLDGDLVKVEAYVLKGERCVYDLVYVAPPRGFPRRKPDFQALVESLVAP
ncbi:MAG: hypothetical protein ACE5FK_04460 [Candidatus Methylomirabilia bacterium]